ncbi:MAG: hypothetical protein HY308_12130 [Gammaproteobacteria bacterium]|nr:hypothetical protein [Gammaproteobacteria bacterium]
MASRIAIVLLTWLSVMPVFAATTTTTTTTSMYEIEVVVFETRLPDMEGSELWTRDAAATIDTATATKAGETPAASTLSSAINALQNDGRFHVLLHRRWLQNADAKTNATPVLLATEDKTLDGALKFYLSRFLHVELNLAFKPQTANLDTAPVYQINEERRIKSQELHFFDHPKFGALVRISPASPG